MTRSEFFKRLGLGALICAVAPKMLAEKPREIGKVFYKGKQIGTAHTHSFSFSLDGTKKQRDELSRVLKFNEKLICNAFGVPEEIIANYDSLKGEYEKIKAKGDGFAMISLWNAADNKSRLCVIDTTGVYYRGERVIS